MSDVQPDIRHALLGPSGCGKTTTLRMIGGFELPTAGRVFLGDEDFPNAKANLVSNLRSVPYDPKRQFSLPWQSGAIGIGYDIKQTGGEITSAEVLFGPKYKGRVTMFTEQYDSAGTVLLLDGKNPTTATVDDQLAAIEKISSKANDAGQFRRFTGNDYTTDLTKGNTSFATIVIAHVLFCVSYVVVTVKARLEGMDPHIEEAAQDLGAGTWTTFAKVLAVLVLMAVNLVVQRAAGRRVATSPSSTG